MKTTETISLRLPVEMIAKLKVAAAADDRTVSNVLFRLVRDFLDTV